MRQKLTDTGSMHMLPVRLSSVLSMASVVFKDAAQRGRPQMSRHYCANFQSSSFITWRQCPPESVVQSLLTKAHSGSAKALR